MEVLGGCEEVLEEILSKGARDRTVDGPSESVERRAKRTPPEQNAKVLEKGQEMSRFEVIPPVGFTIDVQAGCHEEAARYGWWFIQEELRGTFVDYPVVLRVRGMDGTEKSFEVRENEDIKEI